MSWFARRTWVGAALAVMLLVSTVSAAEPVPCFAPGVFAGEEVPEGIWIRSVPREGQLLLGDRVIRPGDVIPAERLEELVFVFTRWSGPAYLEYIPVFSRGSGPETVQVISLPGRKNQAPLAENSTEETYRNLPCEGLLPVTEPEGEAMRFTLTRKPRRGEVILREDGSFLYTPDKNKVGTDSFCFTATDAQGNVSGEATVIVQILKPADSLQYADTWGLSCRFAAEWLRNTGIFSGERIGNQLCFSPEETVSRGAFLVMVMETLGLPEDRSAQETENCPEWLSPYLSAAQLAGILPEDREFSWTQPITGGQARELIRSALRFSAPVALTREVAAVWSGEAPAFPADGADLLPGGAAPVTRAQAAVTLYRLHLLVQGRL